MKFMDLKQKENANIIILPVEYEGSVTWGKGADKGAQEILKASHELEYYDEEFNVEPCNNGINTLNTLALKDQSPKEAINKIKETIQKYKDKFIITLGGDHSVGIACVKACKEPFSVLQFDAHPDLFYSWNNELFNHRCFGYHANANAEKLIQVGIRSMDRDEKNLIQKENIITQRPNKINTEEIINNLTKNVFISIDVDVFDPAFIRNTGTPEPGGMKWQQAIDILKEVFQKKNVIGVNICEFAPKQNHKAESYALAKLLYKIICLKTAFSSEQKC